MAARGKESALDLAKFVDKSIRVKLAGGREGATPGRGQGEDQCAAPNGGWADCATAAAAAAASSCRHSAPRSSFAAPAVVGVLKGYDQLMNLVLDETVEYLRGAVSAAGCCPQPRARTCLAAVGV